MDLLACVVKAIVVLMVALVIGARAALVHRTIQSDDGDVIDCVDMYHQPALIKRGPSDKNKEILQAKPEKSIKSMAAAAMSASKPPPGPHNHQTWRKHGSCPAGTVPIRRNSSRADPEVAERVRQALPFGRPAASGGNASFHLLTSMDTSKGKVEAWPSLFGDSLSRLFVYYTTDGGAKVNCFNLDCGGFHLTEKSPFALGAAWFDFDSQVGGVRNSVTLSIHREPAGENWWVSVMDKAIGYYPESKFNTMFPEADYVEMGGRVLDTRPGGKHTTTPMGSGMPAGCGGSLFAATIMEYLGIGHSGVLFNDRVAGTVTTTPSCYGANPLGTSRTRPGYFVAYGGPGGIYCDKADDTS